MRETGEVSRENKKDEERRNTKNKYMKKISTIMGVGLVLGIILGFLIGYVIRDFQGFTATMPEYDSSPKEKILQVCRDVWNKIQGDSRWVITKHCEDVIDRR